MNAEMSSEIENYIEEINSNYEFVKTNSNQNKAIVGI